MSEIDDIPTVDAIYEDITGDIAVNDALSGLDASGDTAANLRTDIANNSNAGRNRIISYVVASAHYKLRVLFKFFVSVVRALSKDQQFGTKRWWVFKVKKFQYGHDLVHTDKDSYYATVDTDAQVVVQASVEESAYKVFVKVVQDSPQGYRKLTVDQRAALQDYCDEIKPAGIRVIVRSAAPDKIRIYGKVVCDAKQGLPNIQSNAEAAINDYLENLNFDGIFSINQMRQKVLAVPGVIDWEITGIQSRIDASTIWVSVSRIRRAYAGYMRVDAAFPLSSTLQFISSNV